MERIILNKKTLTRTGMEIAVVGMAGKFPKADNISEYWDNIKSGRDCITFFNDDELHLSKSEEPLKEDPHYVKAKGYLDGKDLFDEKFFEYSKSEAKIMEPQMRLFHECVWLALEDAGVEIKKYNPIGLYGGASADTYWKIAMKMNSFGDDLQAFSDEQLTNEEFMCTKIAYKLNLKGPVVYLKTACSTSMAAIHTACRGLLTGECKVAVAGGVSLLLPDKKGYVYREGMIFSPDGYCRAFDDNAHGTVGGEGVGAVVLKRLKEAEAEGDRIYAVIKGSAMNNDGADRVGYTAPSINGQSNVIKKAYKIAKVDPETVTYVEAHGTGTAIGDPIEVEALKEAFSTTKRNFCGLGSVKSNIGHLDSASGVAGFIKCVLSLYNKIIPPTINYETPNKKIDFVNSPFYVNDSLRKWESSDGVLRAGISSFGMGGTNVHIVLENYEYPEKTQSNDYKLLLFSAKTAGSLNCMLADWKGYLQENPMADMSEVAYVLENKRSHFQVHKAIGCTNASDAVKKIELIQAEDIKSNFGIEKKIVFMFPGQGSQYVKMCSGLYDQISQFRSYADECFEIQSKYSSNLKDLWINGTDSDFLNTTVSQPLIFIMEYCISRYLIDLGIKPDIVIGYSFGDYAASCIAGVMSLEDALYVINIRAQLMQETEKGLMLNIPLDRKKCEHYISMIGNISMAIDNGESCVVAGDISAIEKCETVLKNDKIVSMRIGVGYGSHSHLMIPIIERYEKALETIKFHKNEIPMISCVTGEFISGTEVTSPYYWSNHLKECVQFHKAMKMMDSLDENYILVETGPGRNLLTMAFRNIKKDKIIGGIDTIRIKSREIPDEKYFYDKIGILYDCGITFTSRINSDVNSYDPVILPNYSFERNSFGKRYLTDEEFEANKSNFIKNVQKERKIYIRNWERTEKIECIEDSEKKWIIFADSNTISDNIISMLSKNNEICACISSEDFDASSSLVSRLFMNDGEYNILYSYGLLNQENPQKIYCDNLFKIANHCGAANENVNINIFIVCTNSIEAIGCDLKYPDKALLSAALLVVPQEYSNINVKLIDIDDEADKCSYLQDLYNEINCNNDKIVVYRRNYRMLPNYKVINNRYNSSCIQNGGVYILFGGMGGIGKAVTKYLIKKFDAYVIICGRKEIDEKELSVNNDKMEYCVCDISDDNAVEELFEYALKKYGKIDGIFNMAAVSDGKLIQMRTPMDSHKILEPKYNGTNNIIDSCKANNVKLLVLFSSMSSLIGGVGQAAYCAANSYLDACAYYNENFNGVHTICIDWDRWKHTGISKDLESIHYKLTGSVMEDGLDVNEAIELFDKCMCIKYPHLIVLSQDIECFFGNNEVLEEIEIQTDAVVTAKMDRSSLSSEFCAAETETEKELVKLWEKELLIAPIGINDDFLELGGDSLKAIIMITRVDKLFHRNVSVASFLAQPTIKTLAELIEKTNSEKKLTSIKKYFTELDNKTKNHLNAYSEKNQFLDAYYLSPMQNIMLSYNLMNQSQGKNVSMFECIIRGKVDIDIFVKAWQTIIEETPVLRSTFLWRRLPEPIQIIRGKSKDSICIIDLSDLNDNEYNDRLNQIHEEELMESFRVTDYPLHRMKILKRSLVEYRVIVSYMNSLFDGWSTNILLGKLQKYYLMIKNGTFGVVDNDENYYFAALKMQRDNSIANAKDFWKNDFEGFSFVESSQHDNDYLGDHSYYSLNVKFNREYYERIAEYVRGKKITLNSYFQGCWALLISEEEQNNDVVTGYISSGRDYFSDDMLDCIGLFTNIVPLRTIIDENECNDDYFVKVHKHINNINQNSSVLMTTIESIVDAPKEYFKHISYNKTLTLIQYPAENNQNLEFTVENVVSDTNVHVPLRVYIVIEDGIEVKIQYSDNYSYEDINELLNKYIEIAENGIKKMTLKNLKSIYKHSGNMSRVF